MELILNYYSACIMHVSEAVDRDRFQNLFLRLNLFIRLIVFVLFLVILRENNEIL